MTAGGKEYVQMYTDDEMDRCKVFCLDYFNGKSVSVATVAEDIAGTDLWLYTGINKISIDVKISHVTWWNLVLLEYEHTYTDGVKKAGWTMQNDKRTDYIVYYYTRSNNFIVFPFQILKRIYKNNIEEIKRMCKDEEGGFKNYYVKNSYFETENHLVPFEYIMDRMVEEMVNKGKVERKEVLSGFEELFN